MKIIKSYTEILTPINGTQILKDIERVARTCYKSEDKISEDDSSARDIVSKLLKRGHEAMIEFGGDIVVKFICDRGVSHEIVRHRVASYAQESTRYCNYTKQEHIVFIAPNWLEGVEGEYENWSQYNIPSIDFESTKRAMSNWPTLNDIAGFDWMSVMDLSEYYYNQLLKQGWSPQQARSVLPNSLKTEINVKMNIREWRHFFKMRTSNAAHPQMTELTRPLLKQFQELIPILFDDITY